MREDWRNQWSIIENTSARIRPDSTRACRWAGVSNTGGQPSYLATTDKRVRRSDRRIDRPKIGLCRVAEHVITPRRRILRARKKNQTVLHFPRHAEYHYYSQTEKLSSRQFISAQLRRNTEEEKGQKNKVMPDKKDESSKADSKNQRNKEGKEEEEEKVWPERTDPQCRLPRVVIKWLVRCQKTCKKQILNYRKSRGG